jgi:hypothetical protein
MKKEIWILIILAVIIFVLLGFLIFIPARSTQLQGSQGIQIISPKANGQVFLPVKIIGAVSGNGWAGFEGQVGHVDLILKNGQKVGTAILKATSEWTSLPTTFQADVNSLIKCGSDTKCIVSGDANLVFHNENPSGIPDKDKTFTLPIKIGQGPVSTITVAAYFSNNKLDPEISCNKVFAVGRQVPQTTAVARAALEQLLSGPTSAEKDSGFFTSINNGVKIQSLTIENGIAKVDFDEQLEKGVGGSCKVSAIRAQITETLKQFSSVTSVIISINGRTEDILQP